MQSLLKSSRPDSLIQMSKQQNILGNSFLVGVRIFQHPLLKVKPNFFYECKEKIFTGAQRGIESWIYYVFFLSSHVRWLTITGYGNREFSELCCMSHAQRLLNLASTGRTGVRVVFLDPVSCHLCTRFRVDELQFIVPSD